MRRRRGKSFFKKKSDADIKFLFNHSKLMFWNSDDNTKHLPRKRLIWSWSHQSDGIQVILPRLIKYKGKYIIPRQKSKIRFLKKWPEVKKGVKMCLCLTTSHLKRLSKRKTIKGDGLSVSSWEIMMLKTSRKIQMTEVVVPLPDRFVDLDIQKNWPCACSLLMSIE